MIASCLFGVFVLARILALGESEIPTSLNQIAALFWQDLLVALCFAALETKLQRPLYTWTIYAAISLYTAINIPIMRLFSSPLTWPMMGAIRGPMSDSIRHHLTPENLFSILVVLFAAAASPILARKKRFQSDWRFGSLALAITILAAFLSKGIETNGRDRNAIAILISSAIPRIDPIFTIEDWRVSPIDNPSKRVPNELKVAKSISEGSSYKNEVQESFSAFTGNSDCVFAESSGEVPQQFLDQFHGAAKDRNVIVMLLESAGAEYLKPYGASVDPMPNLSSIARESILVENAYSVYPESIKGLFTVLSSQYPAVDTSPNLLGKLHCTTLARVLKGHGYRTGLFHSGRFDYLGMRAIIENQGFEMLEDAGDIGGNRKSSFGIDESATIQRALQWIDAFSPKEKFFLMYLPIAGHHPYDSPEKGPFSEADDFGKYLNALHYGDGAIGELVSGLRQRKIYEKTLFVFLGDHGEAFGQHPGNFGHTLFIYEENIHVPCVIAAPGLFKNQIRDARVFSLIDTAPTILDLLGISTEDASALPFNGRSVLDNTNRMALFFADYSLGFLGLRDRNLKFIYELESGQSKLFDLRLDPTEQNNLASKFPQRAALYKRHLLRWSAAERGNILKNAGCSKPAKVRNS